MNNKGQSLLEFVVSIGLVIVVITGLTITTVNGLRNSQFSKNQTQATKLAQEGLEQTRAIRDRDYIICPSSGCVRWSIFWTDATCTQAAPCTFVLKTTNCALPTAETSPFCLSTSPTPEILNGDLKRQITVTDEPTGTIGKYQKKVLSTVSWNDVSGSHQSELATILANY